MSLFDARAPQACINLHGPWQGQKCFLQMLVQIKSCDSCDLVQNFSIFSVCIWEGSVGRARSGCRNRFVVVRLRPNKMKSGNNEIIVSLALNKIHTHPVANIRICNVGGLELFCSSSGFWKCFTVSSLGPATNNQRKRWKTQTLCKSCALRKPCTLRTIKSCHKLLMLSVFSPR